MIASRQIASLMSGLAGAGLLMLTAGSAVAQDAEGGGGANYGLPTETPPLDVGTGGVSAPIRKARAVRVKASTDGRDTGEGAQGDGSGAGSGEADYVYMGGGGGGSSGPVDDYGYSGGGNGDSGEYGYGYGRSIVPPEHIVRRGDTLWDISGYYFGDPWRWPGVWSLNAQISNPHWIYPGDRVKLTSELAVSSAGGGKSSGVITHGSIPTKYDPRVRVKQTAFVDPKELLSHGVIEGSPEDKEMLGEYDGVYIRFPKDSKDPPKPGKRYTIYRVEKAIANAKGEKVGTLITNLGTLEIDKVPGQTLPVGRVIESYGVIERGDRVATLRDEQRDVQPTANTRDGEGVIIEELRIVDYSLIGEDQFVIVDLGKQHGVVVGNLLMVVRKGDALADVGTPGEYRPDEDKTYPYEVIADLMVVDVDEKSSICIVANSVVELQKGEKVLLRKSR